MTRTRTTRTRTTRTSRRSARNPRAERLGLRSQDRCGIPQDSRYAGRTVHQFSGGSSSVSRRLLVTSALLVSLLGATSACGGSDEPDPTPKATKTAEATPTPKAQPKGADGVTYEIQNWDKYADDPVVLAYKSTNEAIGASVNGRTILPAMREGLSKRGLRTYVPSLDEAR